MATPAKSTEEVNPHKIMSSIMDLYTPASNALERGYKASEAFKPIDADTFNALQAGNIASAENLATSNMWTMTPEMFKMSMDQRPDLTKQAGDVTKLSDALLGRSATREGRQKLALEQARMAEQGITSGLRRAGDLESLAQRDRQLASEESIRNADRASRESQFSRTLKQRQQEWKDKMTEVKSYQKASGMTEEQLKTAPIADQATFVKNSQWLARNPIASMKDETAVRAWTHTYMDNVAMDPAYAGGTPKPFALPKPLRVGNTDVKYTMATPHIGGMLFYATDANGKPVIQEPIHFTPRQIPKQSRGTGSGDALYNRFSPSED
jgi:hypothetical protein